MMLCTFAVFAWAGCPSSRSLLDNAGGKTEIFFENKYFALKDGEYVLVEPIPEPMSVHGNEGFLRRLSGAFSYPTIARENGIEGMVLVEILFDGNGEPKKSKVIKSLSKECDEAALKAINYAVQDGFTPMVIDGNPVKYKIQMPVKFDLK